MVSTWKSNENSSSAENMASPILTDGISVFEALHEGKRNAEVRLYAFDLLADDGVDMRDKTLQVRKLWRGKLLKRSADGILHNDYHHDAGVAFCGSPLRRRAVTACADRRTTAR
jgi:hypothetical protein